MSLNSYFKKVCGINIITDTRYIQTNEVFNGCKAKAKKEEKGARKHKQEITNEDMTQLGVYFMHDLEKEPNPRKLQQCVMLYIIYFFCHRGQENLHDMTQDTYGIKKDDKGRRYLNQAIDEIDKNHRVDDENETNQGRMYETPGM